MTKNKLRQIILEESFPILLDKSKNKFEESYADLLALNALAEVYIQRIGRLESNKAIFKHEYKKEANSFKKRNMDLIGKMFYTPELMDNFDLLCKEIIEDVVSVLDRIKTNLKDEEGDN